MAILCIDFGTSSVRAAVGDSDESIPLVIDRDSVIDNASIPSSICLSSDKKKIFLGTRAVLEGSRMATGGHHEDSPKRWLAATHFKDLNEPMFEGCELSREVLISVFVAYAGQRCRTAAKKAIARRTISDIRISHPVFNGRQKEATKSFYRRLEWLISEGAGNAFDSDEILLSSVNSWSKKWLKPLSGFTSSRKLDVEEPIAAAVQLVKNRDTNQRELTLVVDIGAGTVDFITFRKVTPSVNSTEQRLIMTPAHEPASIWKAGDEIDRILIGIIKRKLGAAFSAKSRQITNEIRLTKKRLFEATKISYEGLQLSLTELETEPAFVGMMSEIHKEVLKKMQDFNAEAHGSFAYRKMTFVFSGGGAGIKAIRRAVHGAAYEAHQIIVGARVPLTSVDQAPLDGYPVDANLERLAVAMGGVTDEEDWPRQVVRSNVTEKGLAGRRSTTRITE